MGGREPGQARDRAAINGYFHVPGFSLGAVFPFLDGGARFDAFFDRIFGDILDFR